MTSNYLPLAVKNIGIKLEDILQKIGGAAYKLQYFDHISSLYRQLALGEMLLTNNAKEMHQKLFLGVQAYIECINNADEAELSRSLAASKMEVFFDAICLGSPSLIQHLAQLAPTCVNARKEYPEDFMTMRIIMDVFGLGKSAENVADLLEACDEYQPEDHRYVLLMALLDNEPEDFNDALYDLITAIRDSYQEGGDLYSGTQNSAAILANISTEVMAWLKLAKKQGFSLSEEYTLAPSSAMAACKVAPPAAGDWRQIESYASFQFKRH